MHKYDDGQSAMISLSHLISIILYCDFSDLCTHFSSTFRKNNIFEPVDSTKTRNSKYHHFSKLLVQTIHWYGIARAQYNGEKGPFYCGISCVMKMPSFAILLEGPCSTSKHLEVSIIFATRDGIIMQLENDGDGCHTNCFDCSWLSKYAEEDERLFISASQPLRMQSIRILETGLNYEHYFHCFHLFHAMLSGVNIDYDHSKHVQVGHADVCILEKLLSNKQNNTTHTFDKYICDCFDLFCYKMEEVEITTRWLHKYFSGFSHLVMDRVVDCAPGIFIADTSTINVLKPKIFEIFPNLKTIIINTTYGNEESNAYPIYRFSLLPFLSFIESCNPAVTYKIVARHKLNKDTNWKTYSDSTWMDNILSSSIKSTFIDHKWNIEKTKNKTGIADILTISKMLD